MKRELIWTLKSSTRKSRKAHEEIEAIKRLLVNVYSFETFFLTNQVFDLRSRLQEHQLGKLHDIYVGNYKHDESLIITSLN